MPRVEVNGTSLEYVERGKGDSVVFFHGGSGDLRAWQGQMDEFAAKYRTIALSCRGYHPNPPLGDDPHVTLQTFVDDIIAFVQALDLHQVHMIGHSAPGGFGSLIVARDHPQVLRSLVLIEPPVFPILGVNVPPTPLQILRLFLRRPAIAASLVQFGAKGIGPASKAFDRGDDEEGLRLFMRANLGAEAFERMPSDRFQQALENIPPLKAQLRVGFPPFSRQDARGIRVRTLLVSGQKSNAVLRSITDALERSLPNARRVTIPNASHNMFETNPKGFNHEVVAFLDEK